MKLTRSGAAQALQRLAATEDGKYFLGYMAAKYGFTRKSTIVPGDEATTYAQEGQRLVLVDIGMLLEADALKLAELEQEDAAIARSSSNE